MFIKLILTSFRRAKLRNFFTFATYVVAFTLLGLLMPLDRVFSGGTSLADANRLIVSNSMSIMQPLPETYVDRIEGVEGVGLAVPFTFFGGFYREPDNQILAIATEPEKFVALIDEVTFSQPQEREVWFSNLRSVAIGRSLADKYDWHVGELISLYSLIYPKKNGSNSWTFEVAAIFDSDGDSGNTESLLIHNDYFNLNRLHGKDSVGWV
ncbi:MAG: hypothetical protein ABJM39_09285, partial [Porticoccus sp.]|uniref:hypothetical protein n=1 Tax=Porticoccus sp. TaxID=2024853 RepID=UPI003297E3A2